MELPLAVLALGGGATLAFMHTEIPYETTAALRAAHPKLDLVTVSLTGGSIEYLPTAAMLDEGGYEGRTSIVRRDAEERLRADLETRLARLGVA